jgi:demethylmenaquinone methyltransferase/2-methoxy-6-polyprenyl-1,4-benzoquinol methylase
MPVGRTPLRHAFTTPDAKRSYVRRLFTVIAPRYDLITILLSYGQDRRWKRRLTALANLRPGTSVLDLACGTGDIAFAAASSGARVVGLDITHRMIELARRKPLPAGRRVSFVTADMTALPFPDHSFEVVTTGYGLRNVPALPVALEEIHRVLVPGGRLLSLDFDRPDNRLMRGVYLAYLTIVGSVLGTVLHGDPDTYRYIPESIRRYPGAAGVCALARRAGFAACEFSPVLGGFMAIHAIRKAAAVEVR